MKSESERERESERKRKRDGRRVSIYQCFVSSPQALWPDESQVDVVGRSCFLRVLLPERSP